MKYLIAGGSGLIGQALLSELLIRSDTERLLILTRKDPSQLSWIRTSDLIEVKQWNPPRVGEWANWIDNNTVIINLAGENIGTGRWTSKKKRAILESRLFSSQALVQAILTRNITPFCYLQASAIGYYGDQGDREIREDLPVSSSPADFLAQVTHQWEMTVNPLVNKGIRTIITRFGIVLSQKGGALPRLVLPTKWFLGAINGKGTQWFSWIHITDLVRALVFLIHHSTAKGAFNIVSPHPLPNREFMKTLGKCLHRPVFFHIPRFLLRVILGEFANTLYVSQRVLPGRLLELQFHFQFPELEEAFCNLLQ